MAHPALTVLDGWTLLVGLAALAWVFLLLGRGAFWRVDQRLPAAPAPARWPAVTAVVPARNEAEGIGACVHALLAQDYPGALAVIVVDDQSSDGTADLARAAARETGAEARFRVLSGAPLAKGWSGKLWAMQQGVEAAGEAPLLWFTDADIVHGPLVLRQLVAYAESRQLALTSLMVMLSCRGWWEKLLIPPFVFFFQKLYPFRWVNDPRRSTAGAAGGCMLVRRSVLDQAGGLAAMGAALIDDCTLAALLKSRGPIWLGLGTQSRSLRHYRHLAEIWQMVARSAYVQLRHSPWRLVAAVLGMLFLYALPALGVILGLCAAKPLLLGLGVLGSLLMMLSFWPTLRLYGRGAGWLPTLPLAALLYTAMTMDSARRYYQGRGGAWKGRTYGPQEGGQG
jgi:hopene-associated glycosyltransferase HpnB